MAVVLSAILLGWMMGRAGWKMAVDRAENEISESQDKLQLASQDASNHAPILESSGQPSPAVPESTPPAENSLPTLTTGALISICCACPPGAHAR